MIATYFFVDEAMMCLMSGYLSTPFALTCLPIADTVKGPHQEFSPMNVEMRRTAGLRPHPSSVVPTLRVKYSRSLLWISDVPVPVPSTSLPSCHCASPACMSHPHSAAPSWYGGAC